jgi:hypothetical protein
VSLQSLAQYNLGALMVDIYAAALATKLRQLSAITRRRLVILFLLFLPCYEVRSPRLANSRIWSTAKVPAAPASITMRARLVVPRVET